MELKDFVKNAILDIVNGVKEAQEADTSGAIIVSPKSSTEYHYGEKTKLRFDIAIEGSSKNSDGGKIGVSAARIFVGEIGGENQKSSSESSRVQFEVEIQLPSGLIPK